MPTNDTIRETVDPTPSLAPDLQSVLVVPVAVNLVSDGHTYTTLILNNTSNFSVNASLVYVDEVGLADDQAASISIPPNGVVGFDDLFKDLYGLSGAFGNLEIRTEGLSPDVLTVTNAMLLRRNDDTLEANVALPVLRRGEGASLGHRYRVSGVGGSDNIIRSNLWIVETTRASSTTPTKVILTLFDENGQALGFFAELFDRDCAVFSENWPCVRTTEAIGDIGQQLGAGRPAKSRYLDIEVVEGSGTIAAVLVRWDRATGQPLGYSVAGPLELGSPMISSQRSLLASQEAEQTQKHVIMGAMLGQPTDSPIGYRTMLGITAGAGDASVRLSLQPAGRLLAVPTATTTIPANTTVEFQNPFGEIFGISPSTSLASGTIAVEAPSDTQVYGWLESTGSLSGSGIVGNLPVIPLASEAVVSVLPGLQRPVYFAGLEQLVDSAAGPRYRLEMTELTGTPLVVTVYLYDADSRTKPIASKDFALSGYEYLVLDSVFQAMGLAQEPLTHDRHEVQVVVLPKAGQGRVAASVAAFYPSSGKLTRYILTPNGGVPATGVSLAAPLIPPITIPRRHSVRRPGGK